MKTAAIESAESAQFGQKEDVIGPSLSSQLLALVSQRPITELDLEMTALFTLDSIAGIVGARTSPKAAPFLNWLASGDEGVGTGRAAMRLGALSNILELDSMHRASAVHAGTVVVPAAFAVGYARRRDGRHVLSAIIKGCEVVYRIGRAVGPTHYKNYQNTSTVGPFGAAVAAGLLMDLSPSELVHAFGNAGTQAGGFWEFLTEGTLTKQLHAGGSAERGVVAAHLAKHFFTGPSGILEGARGFFAIACPGSDPEAVMRAPDSRWELWNNSYKPWPTPRHTHPTIDAALELSSLLTGRPVRRIDVETYPVALDLCNEPVATNEHQAKFSLRYCAVIALLDGQVNHASFASDALIRAAGLVERTSVRTAEPYTSAYPRAWGARVSVTLESGDTLVCTREHAKGDPEAPMSRNEMIAKAIDLFRIGGVTQPEDFAASVLDMVRGGPVPDLLKT